MFTITSIYFLMLFLIFWSYCGYIILLFALSTLSNNKNSKTLASSSLLKIAILIPCYNEESLVEDKIKNLKELTYGPDKFDIYFLDGLSTDNTRSIIASLIKDVKNYHLIETGVRGKIKQLNYGLSIITNDKVDIIVNTDMDTLLMPDVLSEIVKEFNSDNRVAVVGANISPENCFSIEKHYWEDQNLLRILESKVYTSSIVVAPCYSYRANFLDRFPEDCVADDIFVAFKANTEGYITKYVDSISGKELRSTQNYEDFFRHKFRKANAYLIELFRFFYRLPYMTGWWKTIYLTKVLQVAVMPWILPYFILSSISLSLSGWGLFQIVLFGFIFLLLSLSLTSFLMKRGRLRHLSISQSKKRNSLLPFILSNIILILAGLSYPFFRQDSSYEKIGISKDDKNINSNTSL
ncbi:MAG: glycosyltransferase [Nitrospirota bacterium]